jgi:hypothetical protein
MVARASALRQEAVIPTRQHFSVDNGVRRKARGRIIPPLFVKSRPITGEAPTIDLVLGYHKENNSPFLKLFLSRVDDLIARVSKKSH